MIIILLPNYKIYFFVIKLSNELLINFTKALDVRKQHKKLEYLNENEMQKMTTTYIEMKRYIYKIQLVTYLVFINMS